MSLLWREDGFEGAQEAKLRDSWVIWEVSINWQDLNSGEEYINTFVLFESIIFLTIL